MFFGGFLILAFVAIELSFGASLLSGTTGASRSQIEAPTVSIGDLMAPAR
jgi:hypothetical protein